MTKTAIDNEVALKSSKINTFPLIFCASFKYFSKAIYNYQLQTKLLLEN